MAAIVLRTPDRQTAASMWCVRTHAILAIPHRFYDEKKLRVWANVPMPADFPQAMAALKSVVAEDEEEVIGWGMLDPKACQLEALFVDPRFQGRGVGWQICAALEAAARAAGAGTLRLSSTLNAVRFYERAGFSKRGRSTYHHPSGFCLDCVQMRKHLKSPVDGT